MTGTSQIDWIGPIELIPTSGRFPKASHFWAICSHRQRSRSTIPPQIVAHTENPTIPPPSPPCGPWPALGPSMEQLWQADGGGRQSPRGRTGTTSSTTPSLLLPITLANALALHCNALHCIKERQKKVEVKRKGFILSSVLAGWISEYDFYCCYFNGTVSACF